MHFIPTPGMGAAVQELIAQKKRLQWASSFHRPTFPSWTPEHPFLSNREGSLSITREDTWFICIHLRHYWFLQAHIFFLLVTQARIILLIGQHEKKHQPSASPPFFFFFWIRRVLLIKEEVVFFFKGTQNPLISKNYPLFP